MQSWSSQRYHILIWIFLLVLDVTINLVLLVQLHAWSWPSVTHGPEGFTSALLDFSHDFLDTTVISLARTIIWIVLFVIGVRVGTPDWCSQLDQYAYDSAVWRSAKSKWQGRHLNRHPSQRQHQPRLPWSDQTPITSPINGLTTSLLSPNGGRDASSASSSVNQFTNGKHDEETDHPALHHHGRSVSWIHSDSDSEDDIQPEFDPEFISLYGSEPIPPPTFTLTEKMVQNRSAKYRLRIVQCIIFVVGTACSAFLGVKMVGFDFQDQEWLRASGLGLSLILINGQSTLLRMILTHRCSEEGLLVLEIHPHKLYYNEEDIISNHCDLCRNRVKFGYTCRPCDFDTCLTCLKRKRPLEGGSFQNHAEEKEISSFGFMVRALKMALPHLQLVLLAIICLILTSLASIALPNLQGSILDHVINGDEDGFKHGVQLFISVSIALGFFGALRNLLFSIVGANIGNELRIKLFSVIMAQDIAFFDGASSGELQQRLGWDTTSTTNPIQTVLSSSLANMLLLFGGCIMCIYTSWRLSVLAFCSIYPIIIATRAYAHWSSILNRQIFSSYGESTNVAQQAINNIRTVRAFGTMAYEIGVYNSYIHEAIRKSKLDAYVGGGTTFLTNMLDLATNVLLLWYGGSVAMNHPDQLTIGRLITFQLYWNMMNNSYNNLIDILTVFTRASGSAQRVFTLLDHLPDIDPNQGRKVKDVRGEIELRNVSFRYQLRPDHLVLDGVSLKIEPNTVTALVGRSGGGKSTLIHLLMRFYEPSAGEIILDGHSYPTLNLASMNKHFAVVTQNTELFAGSVLENLTYGLEAEDWTQATVEEACLQANCLDFIRGFSEGFETRVGEKGVRLSGGQRQRLSIARAMLRKARFLLLDEATSSLDAESEAQVQAALDKLIQARECTILLVAHRLSTVMNANQICVLDGGRITERGTHDELIAQNGLYAKLVARQLHRKANIIHEQITSHESPAMQSRTLEDAIDAKEDADELQAQLEAADDVDALYENQTNDQDVESPSPIVSTILTESFVHPSPLPPPFTSLSPSPPITNEPIHPIDEQ